jgi:hypothetical protein
MTQQECEVRLRIMCLVPGLPPHHSEARCLQASAKLPTPCSGAEIDGDEQRACASWRQDRRRLAARQLNVLGRQGLHKFGKSIPGVMTDSIGSRWVTARHDGPQAGRGHNVSVILLHVAQALRRQVGQQTGGAVTTFTRKRQSRFMAIGTSCDREDVDRLNVAVQSVSCEFDIKKKEVRCSPPCNNKPS